VRLQKGKREGGGIREEEVIHLRIEEAGGGLDDGGVALISGDLEDVALLVGEDGKKMQANVLRRHVERKRVRNGLCLAGLNLQAVLHGREVAHDALVNGGVLGEVRGGPQSAIGEDDLDGTVLLVGDLDEGGGRSAVDKLDAEDVGVGERGSDIGVQRGRLLAEVGSIIIGEVSVRLFFSIDNVSLGSFSFSVFLYQCITHHASHAPEQQRQRPARPRKRGETI
jgi:hypothetical protein